MRPLLLVALALVSSAAGAQEQKPPAQEEARPAAAPAPRLNLRLDDAARFAREAPPQGTGGAALPTLGADARPLPARILSNPMDGPFPKDTERGER